MRGHSTAIVGVSVLDWSCAVLSAFLLLLFLLVYNYNAMQTFAGHASERFAGGQVPRFGGQWPEADSSAQAESHRNALQRVRPNPERNQTPETTAAACFRCCRRCERARCGTLVQKEHIEMERENGLPSLYVCHRFPAISCQKTPFSFPLLMPLFHPHRSHSSSVVLVSSPSSSVFFLPPFIYLTRHRKLERPLAPERRRCHQKGQVVHVQAVQFVWERETQPR